MTDNYISSYDKLAFSDEEKARIKAKLVAQASELREENESDMARIVEYAPARKRKSFAAAAAVVLALVLGSGGLAYATGNWENVTRFFAGIFTGQTPDTQIVEKIGRPIDASVTDGGITITAEAIMGDRSNYAVVYSLEKEDGSFFDTEPAGQPDSPYLPYSLDGGVTKPVGIDLFTINSNGASAECYFYDEDPSDPAIQYVERTSFMSDGGTPDIIGKTVETDFNELRYYNKQTEEFELIAQGNWKLRFKIDYEDLSREIPVSGQRFSLLEGEATATELIISPLSIRLRYVADGAGNFSEQPDGQMSEDNQSELNRLLDLGEISFRMRDGSVYVEEDHAGGSIDDDGKTCEKVQFLYTTLDMDELESITIGGTTFSVA